jgi:hypothetical protein
VDAPLNNGAWGGPMYNAQGQVVGMALQKFSTQTWWERYDAELGGGRCAVALLLAAQRLSPGRSLLGGPWPSPPTRPACCRLVQV